MGNILYTGGTFDLFHAGHVNFLYCCKRLANKVVVSLNTDEFIEDYKKSKAVLTYEERRKVLMSCIHVDDVVPNIGGADSKPAILSVNPDIIAIGDDWAQKDYYSQMQFTIEWLSENGIVLVYVPYTRSISTTEIKKRIVLSSRGAWSE
jgi:glycerol-3-phosphate cytidylyltransferase